jgi:UDP-glucose 4-epimerase
MTEEMIPLPEDSYGIAKLSVERELQVSHEMFGLDYVIFRPHNVYGERQNIGDRYRNVVGIFMNQLLQGEPMTIFGDGQQKRAFTHISDIAPIIAEAVNVPQAHNEVFNIGADEPFTVNLLSEVVAEAMELPHRVKYLPARNEVFAAFSDHEKAYRVFQRRPSVTLKDGVRAMAKWVKANGARQSSTFSGIEIMKNMPPSWSAATEGSER